MRAITNKNVQVHYECACGYNSIYQDIFPIKWKDLSKVGVVRKKDSQTKYPFLLQKIKLDKCQCNDGF